MSKRGTSLPPLKKGNFAKEYSASSENSKKSPVNNSTKAITEWDLPAQGTGRYHPIRNTIRDIVGQKMSAIRTNADDRDKFDKFCKGINSKRLAEKRAKYTSDPMEVAKTDIAKAVPGRRLEMLHRRGVALENKVNSAMERKYSLELEWQSRVENKMEHSEKAFEHHQIARRQHQLLDMVSVVNSVAAIGRIVEEGRRKREEEREARKKKRERRRLGSIIDEFDTGLEEVPRVPMSVGKGLVLIRSLSVFVAVLIKIRRRTSADRITKYLKAQNAHAVTVRALRTFFERLRRAQRMTKSLVSVSRARRDLLRIYWDRLSAGMVAPLLESLGFPVDGGAKVKSPGSVSLPSPQKTPNRRGSISLSSTVGNESTLALDAPFPSTVTPKSNKKGSKKSKKAKDDGDWTQLTPEAELALQLRSGIPEEERLRYMRRYRRYLRNAMLSSVADYQRVLLRFVKEKERLEMLIRSGSTVDHHGMSGLTPKEALAALKKPPIPIGKCLPPKDAVLSHIRVALNDMIRPLCPDMVIHDTTEMRQGARQFADAELSFQNRRADRISVDQRRRKPPTPEPEVEMIDFPMMGRRR